MEKGFLKVFHWDGFFIVFAEGENENVKCPEQEIFSAILNLLAIFYYFSVTDHRFSLSCRSLYQILWHITKFLYNGALPRNKDWG